MGLENRLNPYNELKKRLGFQLDNLGISEKIKLELIEETPSRWEKLGDLVLLPESTFTSKKWNNIFLIPQNNIWIIFCNVLDVLKVGRQKRIHSGPMRKSQVELLHGKEGIVKHKENNIFFEFDVTKVMFSSGNVSERIRVSKFDCSNEIILDLYAGIGYYTLPLLVHSKAKFLHACEINPDSIIALKKNLIHNKVSDKCIIHKGDNLSIVPNLEVFGKVNRVMLGLLPSSEKTWELAVQSLCSKGGILHLHGNSPHKKEHEWAQLVIERLKEISNDNNLEFKFELIHIEKVKSYAPKINHLVLDIKVFN